MNFSTLQKHVICNDVNFFYPSDSPKKNMSNVCDIKHQASGDTLLHISCRHGCLNILQHFIMNFQPDLEVSNKDGKRLLHEAAHYSQHECLQYLLERKVEVDPLKRADWTPLMLACTKTCVETVSSLLRSSADPNLRNKDGWNSFHIACRTGQLEILEKLLEACPSVWETKSNNMRTPIHTAAFHGHTDVVSWLLRVCFYDCDARDSCRVTPLMDALRGGHVETASVLMEKSKADPCLEDRGGRTALHQVSQTGRLETMDLLVNTLNISVDIRSTISGQTPLHVAAQAGQNEALLKLLNCGADINVQDFKGRTALHQACGGNHLDCVTTLLGHGACLCEDSNGCLPQFYAKKQNVLKAFDSHSPSTEPIQASGLIGIT